MSAEAPPASRARAASVPVIADAKGGFNDPANLWRTVQAFEQAGVGAIHIEDNSGFGKHTDLPQALRPMEEAAARIRSAVEASEDAWRKALALFVGELKARWQDIPV